MITSSFLYKMTPWESIKFVTNEWGEVIYYKTAAYVVWQ